MSTQQLILGNQLFYPFSHLDKTQPIIMCEHHELCRNIKHHKIKVAFFFSAMRHYRDDLIAAGFTVHYINYNPTATATFSATILAAAPDTTTIHVPHIMDRAFYQVLTTELEQAGVRLVEGGTPMLLQSPTAFADYLGTVKKPFMKTYYERIRKQTGILMADGKPVGGQYSFDAMNRKKLPKNVTIPTRTLPEHDAITTDVINMVNNEFSDHPGDARDLWLPVTRSAALAWWTDFLDRYFNQFGDYEDAIDERDVWLFHSAIAPLLNIGLLTPNEVVQSALEHQDTVPINCLEGFIRQVIGWREFVYGIYSEFDAQQHDTNFFNHTRRMGEVWWTGTTGHDPVDHAIKTALKTGYTHHIERLMVLGATMLMCELLPMDVYDWFMSMYADSSDWVMGPNVFGMSQFSDGGIFATKPYICGSNYIRKMSHYGTGDWCDIADGLYWRFIDKHRDFFTKNARMGLAVKTCDKMAADKKTRLFKAANAFITKVSQ
ncbi:MAG: cryptochrome/photolyase family protein [Candidatus Marinamargulisbacteria bacterium]